MFRIVALAALVAANTLFGAGGLSAAPAPIKQSSSGICHCPGGDYYDKTRNFRPFDTIDACLASGGRHPSRGQGMCAGGANATTPQAPARQSAAPVAHASRPYDRDLFGGWADFDGDCQNTRHELLAELSTGPVSYTSTGCTVAHGRWNDPYTGQIYTTARDLDIDHMVPLAYAWDHGADQWDREKRVRFANDPVNLFAVQASTNRQKGASGPLEWMPPNAGFHCQYLLRFRRISISYGLVFDQQEAAGIDAMTNRACQ